MFVIKVILSAIVIATVTTIAKKNTLLAGFIAAFPITSMISIAWMAYNKQNNTEISNFLISVLWGIIPTVVMLVATVIGLKKGMPLIASIGIGFSVWLAFTIVFQKINV
ncbi:DUF3147 family protein [Paenibacillus sp. sptzw28]|uniref:DUF3147 family protein n=1 Tax=Paenibacillus sp. sptzw28 TaxID=715179 RepID=UPI001C6EB0A0|nr:DUF3147 family protein [Paenibacillus sp. sptzw28]QYR22327.1 DUF3147 family protein [Paenibacillus sp. sptzw28]